MSMTRDIKRRPTILMPHWDVRMAMLLNKRNYPVMGIASSIKPDLVLFVDGPPVSPIYHGERRLGSTGATNLRRDAEDIFVYRQLSRKIPKLGVGRGAHLLNMLNGGRAWQLVNGHNVGPHKTTDMITGDVRWLSSDHCQLMLPKDDADIICVADAARTFTSSDGKEYNRGSIVDAIDVEACYYGHTNSLCFQPDVHAGHEGTITYLETLMHECLIIEDRNKSCEP